MTTITWIKKEIFFSENKIICFSHTFCKKQRMQHSSNNNFWKNTCDPNDHHILHNNNNIYAHYRFSRALRFVRVCAQLFPFPPDPPAWMSNELRTTEFLWTHERWRLWRGDGNRFALSTSWIPLLPSLSARNSETLLSSNLEKTDPVFHRWQPTL